MKLFLFLLFTSSVCLAQTDSTFMSKANAHLQTLDTVKLPVLSKADSLSQKTAAAIDSLNDAAQKIVQYDKKLDSLNVRLSARIDSLNKLAQPNIAEIKSLDSLRSQVNDLKNQLDSLETKLTPEEFGKAGQTLSDVERKINAPVQKMESTVNEKLDLFEQSGAQLPSVDLKEFNLPDVSLPGLEKDVSLPGMNEVNISTPGMDKDVLPATGISPSNIPSANTDGLDKIAEVTGKAETYQKDISNISEGNLQKVEALPEELEKQVMKQEQLGVLADELEQAKAAEEKLKRYYDPQVAKEEFLNKAKQEATNHFAGHEQELMAAMEKLNKAKAKMKDPSAVVDMFEKPGNPAKQKSFLERLTPGLSIQVQKSASVWLDVNPHIAYQLSGRFTTGLGWNQRFAYNTRDDEFKSMERIYGPRSFVHFRVKQNFWLKADVECMHAWVRRNPGNLHEALTEKWVWSSFAGFQKDFRILKRLNGNIQLLYNLMDSRHLSPYTDKLNVRMGFQRLGAKKSRNN
jgi:hypothetical protein